MKLNVVPPLAIGDVFAWSRTQPALVRTTGHMMRLKLVAWERN
jgi:hypothetical protein